MLVIIVVRVETFTSDNRLGLVDVGQKRLVGNTTVGRGEASSAQSPPSGLNIARPFCTEAFSNFIQSTLAVAGGRVSDVTRSHRPQVSLPFCRDAPLQSALSAG
jgi:hypothetical protein